MSLPAGMSVSGIPGNSPRLLLAGKKPSRESGYSRIVRTACRQGQGRGMREGRQCRGAKQVIFSMRKAQIPVAIFGGFLGLMTAVHFAPGDGDNAGHSARNGAGAGDAVYSSAAGEELAMMREARRKAVLAALSKPVFVTIAFEYGDTLIETLTRQGVAYQDAHSAVMALKEVYNPRGFRVGQEMTLQFGPAETPRRPLLSLVDRAHASRDDTHPGEATAGSNRPFIGFSFRDGIERNVRVARNEGGDFKAMSLEISLKTETKFATAEIRNSLFQDGLAAGASDNALGNFMRVLSYDVDFQRDIHAGDSFALLYDVYLDPETGEMLRGGDLLYAGMVLSGKPVQVYRFTPEGGKEGYYDADGRSVRKALLRTPVDGARISSGFGKRRHPVLGYSKMHKGLDFAAPTGTPIMAAGYGVVEKAGWFGSYGKYVRIRHQDGYSTAYAHMSRISSKLKPGQTVRQGQIIGYIGTTGRSTGPHLHYEILVNGKQRDPMSVRMPSGERLAGADLKAFRLVRDEIDRQIAARGPVKPAPVVSLPPMRPDDVAEQLLASSED